jgi:methionyl aminopeptidase
MTLLKAAHEITMYGIGLCTPGIRIHEIAKLVNEKAQSLGFDICPDLYGHGTGIQLHELPTIPFHFPLKDPIPNPKLQAGMVITIEPVVMFPSAQKKYIEDSDSWTLRTLDNSWSAQFEHTIAILSDGCEILTSPFSDKLIY